jgi:integrase
LVFAATEIGILIPVIPAPSDKEHMKITFKKPGKGRATYSIMVDGKTWNDPRIAAINADLKAGHPPDTLEVRLRSLIATLRGKEELVPSDLNRKLVEQRHEKKLLRKPDLVDAAGLKQRLLRAAAWLGDISIREASEDELLARLHQAPKKSRPDLIRATNELLRFAGRPTLPMPRKDYNEPAHVTLAEFVSKLKEIKGNEKLYIASLFATGCRFSELPLAVLKNEKVVVKAAIGSRGKNRGLPQPTKNKHSREAAIITPLLSYVVNFVALPYETKLALWNNPRRKMLPVVRKLYGLKLHDLRHCYAIAWGAKGVSVGKVAGWIGDGEKVTRDHYLGYFVSDDEVLQLSKLWA